MTGNSRLALAQTDAKGGLGKRYSERSYKITFRGDTFSNQIQNCKRFDVIQALKLSQTEVKKMVSACPTM
jgi:hypothetical protein